MDTGGNLQGHTPRMNWDARDLPTAFKSFKQHAEFMFDGPLHGKEESVKTNYLMLWAGEKGRQIFSTWNLTEEEKQRTQTYFDKFEQYCRPKSNVIYSRYVFKSRIQREGETFEQFVTDLKVLLDDCGYPVNLKDEMVRDNIVFGVRSTKVREKLINEGTELTLDKCIDIARTHEISQMQVKTMAGNHEVDLVKSQKPRPGVNRSRPIPEGRSAHQQKCSNCGNTHFRKDKCPAFGKQCLNCKRYNHFAVACRSKMKDRKKKVHQVNDLLPDLAQSNSDSESESQYFVDGIHLDKHNSQAFATVAVGPNKTALKFKIDSGAQVNVIPKSMFKALGVKSPLLPTRNKLKAYDGSNLKVEGLLNLACTYNGKTLRTDFFIVDTSSSPILGLDSCLALNMIRLVLSVQSENPYTKPDIVTKYADVFTGLGELPGKCEFCLKPGATPVVHPHRRVPFAIRDSLRAELDKMVKQNVIAKVTEPTDWVNSMVIVEKGNGDLRICLDPKDLNKVIMRPHYPSKTLDDILPDLADASVFSKMDARSGYWSIKLTDKSSRLTTFNTPFGRYRFLRLPFGINCSQDLFQQKMDECLEGLTGVKVIVDDIVVFGKTRQDHDRNLDNLMKRCQEKGIKLNADKTEIGKKEIPFFGHVLTDKGLQIDPAKVKAISEMPSPTSKTELETILGMVTYLQRFAPNLAELTNPLRNLLKKDVQFVWETEQENALQKIKQIITQQPGPVLAYFDPNKDIVLQVDASQNGLGCVLLQDGKPVSFASKSLTETEKTYAQITKELYAVLFACKRFHQMVYGRHVLVQSDHKPLMAITSKNLYSAPPRLQRMLLQLQKYDIEITYVSGKSIPLADTLSRNFLPDTYPEICEGMDIHVHSVISHIPISDSKMELIRNTTKSDSEMNLLSQMISVGWPENRSKCPENLRQFWNYRDELTEIEGIILKGTKIMIPRHCRQVMLDKLHESHLGVEKCLQRARDIMFWPGMTDDIKTKVLSCSICLEHRNSNVKEPMISNDIPDRPWETVATDLFHWNDTNYVVVVDLYSRYFEVGRLTSTKTENVIHKMKGFFATHGIPSKVISDNGPQFSSQEFDSFAKTWDFEHVTSSPLYAQGNGVAERCIQTIKKMFTKAKQAGTDPYISILEYRNAKLACGKSPAQLLMSRELRSILPMTSTHLKPKIQNHKEIKRKMSKYQTKSKTHYDKSAKKLKPLSKGETIRIQQGKVWKPAVVINQSNDRSYIVETEDGGSYRRNRRHLLKTQEKPYSDQMNSKQINTDQYSATPSLTAHKPCVQQENTFTPKLTKSPAKSSQMTKLQQSTAAKTPDDKRVSNYIPETTSAQYVTRSGRHVIVPKRLDL